MQFYYSGKYYLISNVLYMFYINEYHWYALTVIDGWVKRINSAGVLDLHGCTENNASTLIVNWRTLKMLVPVIFVNKQSRDNKVMHLLIEKWLLFCLFQNGNTNFFCGSYSHTNTNKEFYLVKFYFSCTHLRIHNTSTSKNYQTNETQVKQMFLNIFLMITL